MTKIIDLRSDTCTLQPEEMKDAMRNAEVGDEYYDDDPTINKLIDLTCEVLNKEAALFTPSGSMGNLIAMLAQTDRGDLVIGEYNSHSFRCEVSNISAAGGIMPKRIKAHLGIMGIDDIEAAIPPVGYVYPKATILLVENTHNAAGGTCTSIEQMVKYREVADKYKMKIHVDGARIFNAAISLDVKPSELAKDADTLSFCLSKGLSCPFGGMVVGSKETISRARYYKQMFGGGFRQAGYMAACGIYALNHMIDRLAEDHENAKLLAKGLIELGMEVDMSSVQTNMVYFNIPPSLIDAQEFSKKINSFQEIKTNSPSGNKIRLVTHYGIEKEDVEYFLGKVKEVLKD